MRLEVASPCSESWDAMRGDDRVRFCGKCRLNVYNLSDLTEREVRELIRRKGGALCGRLFQRRDGTLLTRDCPAGRMRSLLRRSAAVSAALLAAVLGSIFIERVGRENVRPAKAVQWVKERIETKPPRTQVMVLGQVCPPQKGAGPLSPQDP
jgi:hypothetical protein